MSDVERIESLEKKVAALEDAARPDNAEKTIFRAILKYLKLLSAPNQKSEA